MTEPELTYVVAGMSCEHCRVAVTEEVGKVAGVRDVDVDLDPSSCASTGPPSTARPSWPRSTRPATTRCPHERRPKLAGFAGVLVLAFGGAAFAGSRIDVRPGKARRPSRRGHGRARRRGAGRAAGGPRPGGQRRRADARARAHDRDPGRALRARASASPAATAQTVRDFDVEHTKRMHVIVVRRDLTGFQHVHPVQRPDGTWSVPVTLPDAGAYRVFADFSVDGEPHTLAGDLAVDGAARSPPLPAPGGRGRGRRPARAPDRGRDRAGAESELGVHVTRDGEPVAVEDYLGAKGHLVALREGDLAFLHVHPDDRPAAGSWPSSRRPATTACSCSSRPAAASTPPPSPRR